MVEIGSWIGLAALTRSELTIKNVSWDDLGQIPNVFEKLGIQMERQKDDIYIPTHSLMATKFKALSTVRL